MKKKNASSIAREINKLERNLSRREVKLALILVALSAMCTYTMAQEDTAYHGVKNGYDLKRNGSSEDANKSFEKALEIYNGILKTDPKDINAWDNKSFVLLSLGRTEEAIQALNDAIKNDPNNPKAWNNKGFGLTTMAALFTNDKVNKYNESLQAFDEALNLDPKSAVAWRGKGLVYLELKNYDEALKAFDKAIELNPDLARAWIGKGDALKALGHDSEAEAAYAKAKKLGMPIDSVGTVVIP